MIRGTNAPVSGAVHENRVRVLRTARRAAGIREDRRGWEAIALGALGVLAFSLSFPATRAAVPELGPTLVGLGRGLIAAVLAALVLLVKRDPLPPRRCWGSLALVALGVVFGFSLFSALALKQLPSAHGAVVIGLLPTATALMAVLRAGERPSKMFWLVAALGLLAALLFATVEGAGHPQPADLLLLLAVLLGALGYAEGGRLAREMSGWRVISWALVLALPFLLLTVGWAWGVEGPRDVAAVSLRAWSGVAYLAVISMFLGFFVWYRAMALGGVARIGQLQLAQPALTLLWSALLLGETIRVQSIAVAAFLMGIAALSQRVRFPRAGHGVSSPDPSK